MAKTNKKVESKEILTGKINAPQYVETNGFPEVGQFKEQKDLQKFYKQLDVESLKEWVELEGLEYKECPDSEQIERMRVCMAILYKHFPKETTSTKKESPYKKYSLEDLVALAVENDVAVEPTEDERILRMRTIMQLRAHKILG